MHIYLFILRPILTHKHRTAITSTSRYVHVCPTCGTIEKSGKASCCGRGGSWFRNCGSTGNRKLRHTWSEGLIACQTRANLKVAKPLQPNSVQQRKSSYDIGIDNSKAVITAAEIFTFSSASTSTPVPTTNASTKYHSGTTNSNIVTSLVITSCNDSIVTSAHNSSSRVFMRTQADVNNLTTVTTTDSVTTATITIISTSMITHPVKQATASTYWVVPGI